MQIPTCRAASRNGALGLVASVVVLISASAMAQVNSWVSGSSNWDQPANWSLGILPNSSQSVMITNSGSKAVAINPSTPVNFPNSMTVGGLTVSGTSGAENTLLLNFFGTTTPLHVLNDLNLETNGHVLMLYSSLTVDNMLNVKGP